VLARPDETDERTSINVDLEPRSNAIAVASASPSIDRGSAPDVPHLTDSSTT
jgi:hypothetical protein